jgi:probable F420-dependent oxidoreductase
VNRGGSRSTPVSDAHVTSLIGPEGTLAVGMQLPVQAQSRVFAEPWEHDAGVDDITAIARAADELGFAYLGVCDHIAIPRERADTMGTTWYDTMTTLGFLSGITSRIRLLTHVYVAPLRHPLVAAKALATLDVLSRGRAILGVGAGHVEEEFALTGADFSRRGALLDDAIDVVRAAMAEEFPSHQGTVVSVSDLGVSPRPVQPGGPPIWVGGSSPAALRRAGQRGDGWIPQGTPRAKMPEQLAAIREHRRSAGIDRPIALGAMSEPLYMGSPGWDIGRYSLAGTAQEHAERLREYADMGVSHVQVKLRSRSLDELLDQMHRFAADVLPLLP